MSGGTAQDTFSRSQVSESCAGVKLAGMDGRVAGADLAAQPETVTSTVRTRAAVQVRRMETPDPLKSDCPSS